MAFNIFRPFGSGEPQRDARGRLIGIDRYQDVLGRNWKRFLLSGLCTLAGFLPFAAGVAYAILSSSVLVLLPAGLLVGAVAGPFLACLYDTILRALRDAPWQLGAELPQSPGSELARGSAARRSHRVVSGRRRLCRHDVVWLG